VRQAKCKQASKRSGWSNNVTLKSDVSDGQHLKITAALLQMDHIGARMSVARVMDLLL
jgi:hypothetical protein